jgi:hypothetical protein
MLWQGPISPTDPFPRAMAGADVSYRPLASCHGRGRFLLQTPCLMPWQLLVLLWMLAPHAATLTIVSCRPFSLCYDSRHSMAVAGISCRPFGSFHDSYGISRRPLASWHGRGWCLLKTIFLLLQQTPASPAESLPNAMAVTKIHHLLSQYVLVLCVPTSYVQASEGSSSAVWCGNHHSCHCMQMPIKLLPVAVTVQSNAKVTHLNILAGDRLQEVKTAANTN